LNKVARFLIKKRLVQLLTSWHLFLIVSIKRQLLHSFEELTHGQIKVLADSIEGADADVCFSRFYPGQVNIGVVVKLLKRDPVLLAQFLDLVDHLFDQYFISDLGHVEGQNEKINFIL
jgi:hypothetical protein